MPQCHLLKLIFIALMCVCLSFRSYAAFLEGTEDVPLMPTLDVVEDETFSVDNEDGRLFFSKAMTTTAAADVLRFYKSTLPQLGWDETESGVFNREGDVLSISVTSVGKNQTRLTEVTFEIVIKVKE